MPNFLISNYWLLLLFLVFGISSRADSTTNSIQKILELGPIAPTVNRIQNHVSPEDRQAFVKAGVKPDYNADYLLKPLLEFPAPIVVINTDSIYVSLEERLAFVKTNAFLQKLDAKIDEAAGKEPKAKLKILSEAHFMARIQQAKIRESLVGPFSRELEMELQEITFRLGLLNFAVGFDQRPPGGGV
jgi:hypothetical protein